jgi:3-oxoisoapionate decarboxylase
MGFSVVGRAAGDGRVDFDWVLAELRKRERIGISVIVEHWPPFAGTIHETIRIEESWFAQSVRFLRSRLSDATKEPRS